MPNKDGTGPLGQGAMTGRGLGPCGNGQGMRRGFGRGRGFGCRCRFVSPLTLTKEEEAKILAAELKEIETEKQEIVKRMEELK